MPHLQHDQKDVSWLPLRRSVIPAWETLDSLTWEAYRFCSAALGYLVRLALSNRLAQLHPATEVYQRPDFRVGPGLACYFLACPPLLATGRKLQSGPCTSQIGWSEACAQSSGSNVRSS